MSGFVLLGGAVAASWLLRSPAPLAAYIMGVLGLSAWHNRDGTHLRLYRKIRPGVVGQSVLLLLVVGGVIAGLLSLGNPVLSFSWLALVMQHEAGLSGGSGGSVGTLGTTSAANGASNVLIQPLSYPWLILPFAALLLFLLPRLALSEERLFRNGTRSWRQGAYRSLLFGLAHLTMGIPIGAALGLSIGGLWFTHQYFRGGVERATIYHLTYNLVALGLILLLVLVPL